MKKITSFIFEYKARIILYSVLILVAIFGTWWTYNYAINFSAIPITFVYLIIYIGFFEIFDRFILTGFDTIHEIKNGNIAVAIYYVALSIILLGVAVLVG
jgi:hypothetical protein